ncbi:MAG: NAD-dependent epimerase/dehydratase family protein, partial [Acidimicrobiales bacterium]|nr:NAD-dependent epimerase/dehydratase family protein [Acidimicrobiales bacterium]
SVRTVVAIDRRPTPSHAGGPSHVVDLASADLKPLFDGASAVLHLAQADDNARTDDAGLTHRVLEASGATGVAHVVLLSSAAAYGAWANNPVPLTEDAALRPNPGIGAIAAKAEVERAAMEFREGHPGTTVTLLRPTVAVAAAGNSWLARVLSRSRLIPVADDEPPAQFLDVADLAAAVDLARRVRIDGPRNVAPDGWIDGDTARSLAGGGLRLRLPERVALRLVRTGWSWGLSPTPPELLPYVVHPWVIANDRLKADGWTPASSNEEALVASHRPGPWLTLSPARRQELALGVAGAVLVGAAVGLGAVVRRRIRR